MLFRSCHYNLFTVIVKYNQIGNCLLLIINSSSPSVDISLMQGISHTWLLNLPPSIYISIQRRPIYIITIQVPLQSPSLGERFYKRITGAPTFRESFDGDKLLRLNIYRSSTGGSSILFSSPPFCSTKSVK